jgi:hypothetical protein
VDSHLIQKLQIPRLACELKKKTSFILSNHFSNSSNKKLNHDHYGHPNSWPLEPKKKSHNVTTYHKTHLIWLDY